MRCDPADSIIKLLGGLSAVAKAANTTATTVMRWRMPREKGGTGGFVPRKYHDFLISLAAEKGIDLAPAAFVDTAALPSISETAA